MKRIFKNLKKIFIISILFCLTIGQSFALVSPISEKERVEVEKFFDNFVNSANNYEENLINMYDKNAKIERIVLKPDGTKQTVEIPIQRYVKELKSGRQAARLVRYKNRYINKKFEKLAEGEYKIKTKRIPFKDKNALNAEFTVKKTDHGLKICHEAMETTVQKFLKANP